VHQVEDIQFTVTIDVVHMEGYFVVVESVLRIVNWVKALEESQE